MDEELLDQIYDRMYAEHGWPSPLQRHKWVMVRVDQAARDDLGAMLAEAYGKD